MAEQIKKMVPQIRFKGFSEEWKETKLGEIYQFKYGYFNNNPSDGGKYPVYGANGIIGGYSIYNAEDSIIIGHMGEYAGSVLWGEGKHFVTYNGIISTPKKTDLNSKFGYYLFSHLDIRKICGGSGQPFLSYETLQRLDVTCPKSTTEQSQIYSYFAELDQMIGLHQRKHEKLVLLKKAMLKKMFPQNGATTPEIRFKGFSEPWVEKTLWELVDLRSGRDYKHLSFGNIPVYGTGGYMLSVDQALSYDENAVGIGRKGTIDKPYVLKAPFWTVDTLFYAVPKGKNDLNFVHDIFQQIDWKQKDESTGVPSLSKVTINNVEVLSTTPEEQQEIGTYFRQLDELIAQHETQVEKLKQIKTACLGKMFV